MLPFSFSRDTSLIIVRMRKIRIYRLRQVPQVSRLDIHPAHTGEVVDQTLACLEAEDTRRHADGVVQRRVPRNNMLVVDGHRTIRRHVDGHQVGDTTNAMTQLNSAFQESLGIDLTALLQGAIAGHAAGTAIAKSDDVPDEQVPDEQ